MNIELNDAICARIQELVESGTYSSADQVVDTALSLLHLRDSYDEFNDMDENEIIEIRERAQRGAAQADRGETIPADVVFERLMKRNEEWANRRE